MYALRHKAPGQCHHMGGQGDIIMGAGAGAFKRVLQLFKYGFRRQFEVVGTAFAELGTLAFISQFVVRRFRIHIGIKSVEGMFHKACGDGAGLNG